MGQLNLVMDISKIQNSSNANQMKQKPQKNKYLFKRHEVAFKMSLGHNFFANLIT